MPTNYRANGCAVTPRSQRAQCSVVCSEYLIPHHTLNCVFLSYQRNILHCSSFTDSDAKEKAEDFVGTLSAVSPPRPVALSLWICRAGVQDRPAGTTCYCRPIHLCCFVWLGPNRALPLDTLWMMAAFKPTSPECTIVKNSCTGASTRAAMITIRCLAHIEHSYQQPEPFGPSYVACTGQNPR